MDKKKRVLDLICIVSSLLYSVFLIVRIAVFKNLLIDPNFIFDHVFSNDGLVIFFLLILPITLMFILIVMVLYWLSVYFILLGTLSLAYLGYVESFKKRCAKIYHWFAVILFAVTICEYVILICSGTYEINTNNLISIIVDSVYFIILIIRLIYLLVYRKEFYPKKAKKSRKELLNEHKDYLKQKREENEVLESKEGTPSLEKTDDNYIPICEEQSLKSKYSDEEISKARKIKKIFDIIAIIASFSLAIFWIISTIATINFDNMGLIDPTVKVNEALDAAKEGALGLMIFTPFMYMFWASYDVVLFLILYFLFVIPLSFGFIGITETVKNRIHKFYNIVTIIILFVFAITIISTLRNIVTGNYDNTIINKLNLVFEFIFFTCHFIRLIFIYTRRNILFLKEK